MNHPARGSYSRRNSFWTDQRDAKLRQMRADGVTTDNIAAALGCTRNAVVGRALRKGFETPNKSNKPVNGKPRTHAERRKPVASKARVKAAPRRPTAPKVQPQPPVIEQEPEAPAISKNAAWEALPGTSPVPIHEHTTGCRWPIGDPLKPGFGFCNEAPKEGSSYCTTHAALGRRETPNLTKPRKGTGTFKSLGEAVQRVFG